MIGDTGKYRHRDSCEAFQRAVRGSRRPSAGRSASVPATEVDLVTGRLLERFALRAESIARVVGAFRSDDSIVDAAALARIERQRSDAMDRYRRDRDAGALERTMADLDRAEAIARQDVPTLRPAEVVETLRSLPAMWHEAPETRHHLAESLFDRVEIVGVRAPHLRPVGPRDRARDRGRDALVPDHLRWIWSGREDLNLRPQRPERCALPSCATPRPRPRRQAPAGLAV